MNKTKLSPYDWDMCAMIEDITGKAVFVQFTPESIKLSWTQTPCETVGERQRLTALEQAIAGRLGNRLLGIGYGHNKQTVSFDYDPTEYPEETRFTLMNPTVIPETRYKRKDKEVDAVLFVRDNIERVNAFTGGGTLTIPSKANDPEEFPDMRATFTFPNQLGLLFEVKEGDFIINDNGKFTAQNKQAFEQEYESKYNFEDYEQCENCESRLPYDQMLHDDDDVSICPQCMEELKGNPNFEMVGIIKISEERKNQIFNHGFDNYHDRKVNGEGQLKILVAAIMTKDAELYRQFWNKSTGWCWNDWHKIMNKSEVEQLAICGALTAAEIERIESEIINH